MKPQASLFRRTAITLAIGLLVFQIAAGTAIFSYMVFPLAQRSAEDLADLLLLSARVWNELPTNRRPEFAAKLQHDYALTLHDAPVKGNDTVPLYPYLYFLNQAFKQRLPPNQMLHLAEDTHQNFQITFELADTTFYFEFAKSRITPRPRWALTWIGLSGLFATLALAWLLARRVTAPIAKLAEAAKQIGQTGQITKLPEDADAELANLAGIFNETSRQLQAQRENQTTLLAGVSHDLRSPLARMKMAVGLLSEEYPSSLLLRIDNDIAEMDSLIGAQLELARAQESESSQQTDIDALLEELLITASTEAPVHIILHKQGQPCICQIAPMALRRCISNLLNNAIRYAGDRDIQLIRRRFNQCILIGVRDRGPGIPPELAETVFRPFYRLESSRNRFTGGSGLGLAITRQLSLTQGWKVAIKSRRGGGTSVWLKIKL